MIETVYFKQYTYGIGKRNATAEAESTSLLCACVELHTLALEWSSTKMFHLENSTLLIPLHLKTLQVRTYVRNLWNSSVCTCVELHISTRTYIRTYTRSAANALSGPV